WSIYYFIEAYRRQESSNKMHYLLSYLLTFVVVFFVESYLAPNGIEMPNTFYTDPGWAIIFSLNTMILIIQNLHITREKKSIVELENSRLKLRNAEAMNQKLKRQIRPHFLFNAL